MSRIAPVVFAVIALLPAGLVAQGVSIPTEHRPDTEYYLWITELSTGPISWTGTPDTDVEGYYYRAVITTREVYSTLIIEYMTLGEEGCCKQIASVRHMISDFFAEAFAIRGEFAGLSVAEWQGPDRLVVEIQNRRFVITLAPDGPLLVEELGV